MRSGFLLLGAVASLLIVSAAFGQTSMQSYEERQEALALERARMMKALKEQAAEQPFQVPPRPASAVASAPVSRPAPEPFYFMVKTPGGLVPLEAWKQAAASGMLAENGSLVASEPVPVEGEAGFSRIRSWSVSLFEARPPVEGEDEAARVDRIGGEGAEPVGEMLAVMEESGGAGSETKRNLLGFMVRDAKNHERPDSGELAADLDEPLAGETPESESGEEPSLFRMAFARPSRSSDPVPRITAPVGEARPDEELASLERSLVSRVGGRLSADPATPAVGDDLGSEDTNPDYYTINTSAAPFHVIDAKPDQTYLVEVDPGIVGRKHGDGDAWAWLELDSGLMGLMRKKHLRPSTESEVMAFLAVENSGSAKPGTRPVQYVDVELPDLPSEAGIAEMMPLGGSLFPTEGVALPEMTDAPGEEVAESVEEPAPLE